MEYHLCIYKSLSANKKTEQTFCLFRVSQENECQAVLPVPEAHLLYTFLCKKNKSNLDEIYRNKKFFIFIITAQ